MSVRQLHYTSCEDGLEGIQGFQVSATTPGLSKFFVDLAVRSSAYEAGPGLVERLADDDLSTFPIAFGYTPAERAALLFQSRYVGPDFTGRLGNYFAHALVVDDVDRELGAALPIDLWRSQVWSGIARGGETVLPELDTLPPGTAADPSATRRFLGTSEQRAGLIRLVSTVQPLLATGRGRLALVVPDDQHGALWLAALTRSLPRHLALSVSFVTYTSRPHEQELLVSCTTPDVFLPAYGDYGVLDLCAPGPGVVGPGDGGRSTRYAAAVAKVWEAGAVDEVIRQATLVRPALAAGELDLFATALTLTMDLAGTSTLDEQELLAGLAFAQDRLPGSLRSGMWQRVVDMLTPLGGPHDLMRWCAVLRSAVNRAELVPTSLLVAYFVAAMTASEVPTWLPKLDETALADVAHRVLLPLIVNGDAPTPVDRLAEQHDLVRALVRALDRRLAADATESYRLVERMRPEVARILLTHDRTAPRVAMVTDIVFARHGLTDPVAFLASVAHNGAVRGHTEWQSLGRALWPGLLSTADARRALRHLPPEVLAAAGVLERSVERILQDADDGEMSEDGILLAKELLGSACVDWIPAGGRASLQAVHWATRFRRAAPPGISERDVREALGVASQAGIELSDRILVAIALFLLRVRDPLIHSTLLDVALDTEPRRFLSVYCEVARAELARAAPEAVATAAVVWAALPNTRIRLRLIDETLAEAMSGRRRRDLNKMGDRLEPIARHLGARAPRQSGGWRNWWQAWRHLHERRGLLRRLGLGRR
ncbi:hypothetical protein F0L68_17735 [Solihabitans fulvus]|uniref:Uncharacterized protein n=1 Tax=Solihabitans fulvus TaxID=1892852 RepID=A0A5B2XDQ9_9PSEU|nr:GTPase-associated protein 1-related protein [Solihabitans fulvus]KAA2261294.1 hypothetical protein F0L68_17735 [Solihabitans fulvus]